MNALKALLKQLADRIDALSVRERGIVFIAGLVVLYLFAFNVVFGPLRSEQTRLEQSLKAKREQVQNMDNQLNALLTGEGKDINAQNQAKIAALSKRLTELDAQMDQMTAGVVNPKEMARLVEQLLTRNKNLQLMKLEALPPKPIGDENKSAEGQVASVPSEAMVYRHGMRIEFKGRYFDIVEYLKAMESLQWKVFWGEVTLETDKYPVSKVSLVIYTLSRYPGWIGV